ncbi:hypothetical protein MRX96_044522 [Rhipicephalus microplus]
MYPATPVQLLWSSKLEEIYVREWTARRRTNLIPGVSPPVSARVILRLLETAQKQSAYRILLPGVTGKVHGYEYAVATARNFNVTHRGRNMKFRRYCRRGRKDTIEVHYKISAILSDHVVENLRIAVNVIGAKPSRIPGDLRWKHYYKRRYPDGCTLRSVKLAKPIPRFDSFVRPVCLPKQGEKTRRGPMVMAGYGRPGRKKPGRRLLYYIPTASSDATCDVDLEVEWWMHPMKRNLLICTKHPRAMMYHGDSGSPLTAYSRYGRWTQYGIASFIRSSNAGYAPTVSTRVSMFIDWIKWALRVTGRRKNRC